MMIKLINKYRDLGLVMISLLFFSLSYGQIYNPILQNENWNSDSTESTVFFKGSDDLEITPNLKMLLFQDKIGRAHV